MDIETGLIVFQDRAIRRTWHKEEWWFVLEDIIMVLTDSKDTKQYIQKMKQRDQVLAEGWVQIVLTLSIPTAGGKQQMDTVIQSCTLRHNADLLVDETIKQQADVTILNPFSSVHSCPSPGIQ